MSPAQVSAFRLGRHHLLRRAPRGEVEGVVGDVCGVQAQVMAMARIALWARLRSLTTDDVERALVERRTLVKVWSMRSALHLHPSGEVLVCLRGLVSKRLPHEQRWIRGAGLDEGVTTAMVLKALEDGPLTRRQLSAYLGQRLGAKTKDWVDGGWGRRTEGSSTTWHLVRPAVARGLVCFGPSDGQEVMFTRIDRWLRAPPPVPPQPIAEEALLRKYLRCFGPADVKDVQAWSGLFVRDIRATLDRLQDELLEVECDGRPGFVLRRDLPVLEKSATDRGAVALLPSFDPFLLGHYHRTHLVDQAHYRDVYKEQGWLAPVVLVDGGVAGTWTYRRRPGALDVEATPFTPFSAATRGRIKEEAHDLARFLDARDVSVRFAP